MSKKQIDIALKKINVSQSELGHKFQLDDFKALIEVGLKSRGGVNKDAHKIIIKMVSGKKA